MSVIRMLDRGSAPSLLQARAALTETGGSAWAFYLGGAGHQGFTAYTKAFVATLMAEGVGMLPIYVGAQGALSHQRGVSDALDAVRLSATFGDPNRLLVTDIERFASDANPAAAVDYMRGWTQTLHQHGFLSAVYGSLELMNGIAAGAGPRADAIWPAAWLVDAGKTVPQAKWPSVPTAVPKIAANLWNKPGQRAWQFLGDVVFPASKINVDVSVIDAECFSALKPSPPPLRGTARPPVETPHDSVTPPTGATIVVQPDDTLSELEATHGLPAGSLFAANRAALDATARAHGLPDSDNGNKLFPGQVLRLPTGATTPAVAGGSGTIVVRPDDVLSLLEIQHGLAPGTLFAANRVVLDLTARQHGLPDSDHGNKIFPGQVLVIP